MLLVIDNTEDDRGVFYAEMDNKFVQGVFKRTAASSKQKTSGHNIRSKVFKTKQSDDLLVCLDKFLSDLNLSVKDITCVGVVMGVGRFTATRLAVTLANTLAYGLHIPVIKLEKNFDQRAASAKAKEAKAGQYVMPEYSAEAHIQGKNNQV